MKYRLVLLNDDGQEVGTAMAVALRPSDLLIVMPQPGEWMPVSVQQDIGRALSMQLPGQAISVLPIAVSFARLEQVDE